MRAPHCLGARVEGDGLLRKELGVEHGGIGMRPLALALAPEQVHLQPVRSFHPDRIHELQVAQVREQLVLVPTVGSFQIVLEEE